MLQDRGRLQGIKGDRNDEAVNRILRGVSAHFKDFFRKLLPNGAGELVMHTSLDNDDKTTISRLKKKSKDTESKESEIMILHQLLKNKVAEEKKDWDQLARNKKYQYYLKNIMLKMKESSDNMLEIQDILDKYEILKNANDDLLCKIRQNNEDHEQRRSSHIQLTKDGGNFILNNPNLDKIRLRLEEDGSSNDHPRDNGCSDVDYGTSTKFRGHDPRIVEMGNDTSVVIPILLAFSGEYSSVAE